MIEQSQFKFERVMIIDDSSIDLYILSRLISKNYFGKKVLQYSSAREALNFLIENQDKIPVLPQVIFLDIYMPEMTGLAFIEEYDKLSVSLKSNCRIYFLSSSLDEQDVNFANNDENVVEMQEKPISKEFLNAIQPA